MVLTGVLANASSDLLSSLGRMAIFSFVNRVKDWPSDPAEALDRANQAKSSSIDSVRKVEDSLSSTIKLLTKAGQMKALRKIGAIHEELSALRHEIESKTQSKFSSFDTDDILKAYSMIYLSVIYDTLVLQTIVDELADIVDDEEWDDLDASIKRLKTAMRALDTTWKMFAQATSDPTVAKSMFQQLKNSRKKLVNYIEEVGELSNSQMEQLISGVVIKKPKLFGKKKYRESIADLLFAVAKELKSNKIELNELLDRIRKLNPNVQMTDEDLEKAVEILIDTNRAYALTVEDNFKYIEFRKSDESLVCGNCSISGGVYREFKKCMNTDLLVCDECVTFFGKCKICHEKVKNEKHLEV